MDETPITFPSALHVCRAHTKLNRTPHCDGPEQRPQPWCSSTSNTKLHSLLTPFPLINIFGGVVREPRGARIGSG